MRLVNVLALGVLLGCGSKSATQVPPAAPTGVTATAGTGQIALSWTAVSGATGYVVQRGTIAGGPYSTLASPTATSYADTSAQGGTRYYYVVQAVNAGGTSANSAEVSAALPSSSLAVPTGLAASIASGQIVLTWTASAGAMKYSVKRSATAGGPYGELGQPAATTLTDATAAQGLTWFYVVAALSGGIASFNSSEVSATTIPATPAGLSATGASTSIALQWTASPGAVSYDVLRAPAGSTTFAALGTSTTAQYTDTGLALNSSFSYQVSARNAAGASAPTAAVAGATTAFLPPTGLTATSGNAKVSLAWTGSAGATGYKVLRGTSSGGPYAEVSATITGTTAIDATALNGTTYDYVVEASVASGDSGPSNQATATPRRELCVLDSLAYRVSVFDADQNGDGAPLRSFGWNTGLQNAGALSVDEVNHEVIAVTVPYGTAQARIAVFSTGTADVIPLRTFDDYWHSFTLRDILVDPINNEIYLASENHLYVYSRTATGAARPKRSIPITGVCAISLDLKDSELFAASCDATTISVFNRTDSGTSVLPIRTISPQLTGTNYVHAGSGMSYDAVNDALILLLSGPSASNGSVAEFARMPGGATNPLRPPLGGPSLTGLTSVMGLAVDASAGLLFVGATDAKAVDSIRQFPLTASGDVAPTKVIAGLTTSLYGSFYGHGGLAIDLVSHEVWKVNSFNRGLASFHESDMGDVAPVHSLSGSSSGLFRPTFLLADRTTGTMLVINQGQSVNVATYPLTADGAAVTPLHVLGGAATTLVNGADSVYGAALDPAHREVWLYQATTETLAAFSLPADGDQPPARAIAGEMTTLLSINQFPANVLAYDARASELLVANIGRGSVLTFPQTASGNIAPARHLDGFDAYFSTVAVDTVNNELLVADSPSLSFFTRDFTSGLKPAPQRSFNAQAPAAIEIDPAAGEVLVPDGNSINVYSRTGVGPRQITGPLTGLHGATAAVVCN